MKYNNLLKSEGAALNLLFGNGKGFRIYQAKFFLPVKTFCTH